MDDEREINSASFYLYLREKKLMASRCKKCLALYLPPHSLCAKCEGDDMEWVEMKGSGKLAAFTAISVGPTSTLAEGYDRNNPYLVGIVHLGEGPKISARILGIDPMKPESIEVGTPLTVEFLEPAEGKTTYVAFKA